MGIYDQYLPGNNLYSGYGQPVSVMPALYQQPQQQGFDVRAENTYSGQPMSDPGDILSMISWLLSSPDNYNQAFGGR